MYYLLNGFLGYLCKHLPEKKLYISILAVLETSVLPLRQLTRDTKSDVSCL